MNLQKAKAILFDLDGTLLDTVYDIGAGVNNALRRYGLPEHDMDAYRGFVGHGIDDLFRDACPEDVEEQVYRDALALYKQFYPENCTSLTTYFSGIEIMLEKLQNAGYTMAIISNKTETSAIRITEHYFSAVKFEFIWGNNGQRPLKPAIHAGEMACEKLGLTPEDIVFFGDGDTDMEFGSKMGFHTIGCSWGYRNAQQLRESGAHLIVDTAEEFLQLFSL